MAFGARKLSSPSSSSSGDKNLKHTNDKIGNSKLSASSMKGRGSVGGIKRKMGYIMRPKVSTKVDALDKSVLAA
ncbi:hypothetical protein JHK87_047430 [Glycine soja]|nr:hypothetical protein JHK87_047430 [Glycine soja]